MDYPEALQVIKELNNVTIANAATIYRSLYDEGELHKKYSNFRYPNFVLYFLPDRPEAFWGRILLAIAFELKRNEEINQQGLSAGTDGLLEKKLEKLGFKAVRYKKKAELRKVLQQETVAYREGKRGRSERDYYTRRRELAELVKANANHTCQCCGHVGKKRYTQYGERSIEAHHLIAFKDRDAVEKIEGVSNKPEDMAALCANCHRAIHGQSPALTIDELKKLLSN